MFISIMIRPRMGMAVIDIAVPMNSAKPSFDTGRSGPIKCGNITSASPKPNANGSTTPAVEIASDEPRVVLR